MVSIARYESKTFFKAYKDVLLLQNNEGDF